MDKRQLARDECARHGHDWVVSEDASGSRAVTCARCERSMRDMLQMVAERPDA